MEKTQKLPNPAISLAFWLVVIWLSALGCSRSKYLQKRTAPRPRARKRRAAIVQVLHISGGCLNAATQTRSEFRRTRPLQTSSLLSPVALDEAKEIGPPPVDGRSLQTNTPQQKKAANSASGISARQKTIKKAHDTKRHGLHKKV